MGQQAARLGAPSVQAGLEEARIVAVGPANRVSVEVPGANVCEAAVAVAGGYEARSGDVVLVAGAEDGKRYVIGVLVALREVHPVLRSSDGASAEVVGDPGQECLMVRDSRGTLLFEHRVGEGRSIVYSPERNLEFRAEGSIDFVARDSVRVRGARDVELAVHPERGDRASRVALNARGVELAGQNLEARAQTAAVTVGEATVTAKTLTTLAQKTKQLAEVMEVRVTRLVEHARDVYREAEGLSQTRAGRLKLLAENTLHVFGKRALFKADKDLKLNADKIHLG